MKFSTVFFDLGSTLVYSKDPWPPIYARADRAMLKVLADAGIKIDSTSFYVEFGGFIQSYYAETAKGTTEPTTFAVLMKILKERGYQDVPPETVRNALDAMYSVIQKNWHREEEAIQALDTLKTQGYRLGVISNTSDDLNVKSILDKEGLRPYFETIITSAALGIRKPERRIFETALDFFQVSPADSIMVGDTLQADILGANQMGIYSIWINRRQNQVLGDGELAIQPQAVVSALDQIPDLLKEVMDENQEGYSQDSLQNLQVKKERRHPVPHLIKRKKNGENVER